MKFYIISESNEAITGLRLAGIEGEKISNFSQIRQRINSVVKNEDIGILLMTPDIMKHEQEFINEIKLTHKTPLILEVPYPGKLPGTSSSLEKFVSDAIGINIF